MSSDFSTTNQVVKHTLPTYSYPLPTDACSTHDDVEVQVVDRLAALRSVVHHHPEPFVEPLVCWEKIS